MLNRGLIQQIGRAVLPKLREDIAKEARFQAARQAEILRAGPPPTRSPPTDIAKEARFQARDGAGLLSASAPGGPLTTEKLRFVMDDRLHQLWGYVAKLEAPMLRLEEELAAGRGCVAKLEAPMLRLEEELAAGTSFSTAVGTFGGGLHITQDDTVR